MNIVVKETEHQVGPNLPLDFKSHITVMFKNEVLYIYLRTCTCSILYIFLEEPFEDSRLKTGCVDLIGLL